MKRNSVASLSAYTTLAVLSVAVFVVMHRYSDHAGK